MDLKNILKENETLKNKIKILFQTRGKIKSFLDFEDMEIAFYIKPPINEKIIQIAQDILEVDDNNGVIIRGKGIMATEIIKNKINKFIEELEKIV
ncbi:MAG: hypothetical protein ACTSRZ_07990 [Promethearchaeota archaeon]